MMKTYKFNLEPTKQQAELMDWTLTMCRQLYNALLEQRIFAYKRRNITVHYYEQKKGLPLLKKKVSEYNQIQSQVLQYVVKRLNNAFQAFFRRLTTCQKAGFPRFQGKNRYDSFTYPPKPIFSERKFFEVVQNRFLKNQAIGTGRNGDVVHYILWCINQYSKIMV